MSDKPSPKKNESVAEALRNAMRGRSSPDTPQNTPEDASLLANRDAQRSELLRMLNEQMISGDMIDELPADVKFRATALKTLATKYEVLRKQFVTEYFALLDKYNALYAPLYERRAGVVRGTVEPAAEDFTSPEEFDKLKSEAAAVPEADRHAGVPSFWPQVLSSIVQLGEMIEKHDTPVLEHLVDVRVVNTPGKRDFKLEFEFSENAFFSNTVLTKEYKFDHEDGTDPDPPMEQAIGTTINWKPGKDVTHKTVTSKGGKGKGGRNARPKTKVVEVPSFFKFFSPPNPETWEPSETEDDDEEEDISELMERDLDLGLFFKDQIIPNATSYFLGEFDDEEFDDMEGGEEEEEDDDEDEDDSDDEAPKGGKAAPKAGFKFEAPKQEECKNQ